MTARIVVIGESLVDVVLGAQTVEHPGGSPLNIAYGLARLGRPVTLVTALGDDERGRSVAQHVLDAGVEIHPSSFRHEPTSSATARLRDDGSADYTFDLRWSLPAPHELHLPEAALVHVGSLGVFLEPGGTTVVDLLRAATARGSAAPASGARESGALASSDPASGDPASGDPASGESRPGIPLIAFDPNMRPSIVTDHAAAFARFEEVAALTTVLKLSDEDAEWLYPGATVDEAIDRILALGPILVAVTRGGEGAVLATAADRVAVPGRRVDVVDTIGAGDSFMSALLLGVAALLDEETTAPDASRDPSAARSAIGGAALDAETITRLGDFAVRCAAITVSRAGANPPTLAEVS
ncbi:carbohydrate kinase family protein [Herbiconiux liukaitaii]|uniref:carbohydrate kinase family protein n=1 Tax=Herbiconiux liukaitaii TaxID=3342799 RepID=UPI0035B9C240